MVPGRFSTRTKGIIVFCCILLLVASVLLYSGYTSQAGERKHFVQLHLQKVAGRIAGQVNGDGLLSLKPGDEGTPAYLAFANTLYDARKNDSFIVTAYLLRVDNSTISYVVHDAYLANGPDSSVARIGDRVTEDKDVIMNASASGPVYSPDFYTSKWGSYLSGYAPLRDSNGTVVGVLGVDEMEDTVLSYETYRFFNLVEVV
jgi:hypothetical protein